MRTGPITIDMRRIRKRKRDIVTRFRTGSEGRLESTPRLDLLSGEASFTGPKAVLVRLSAGGLRTVTADRIFINAGCRPEVPALAGIETVPFLDSTSIMELGSVPPHLLVLGGGYVGLEFAQLFRRLGSRVTIVHSTGQLLDREDPDIAAEVAAILEQDGLKLLLNARAERVRPSGKGLALTVRTGRNTRTVSGSHLLVATGRTPDTSALKLAVAGVATDDHGFIKVDGKLQTSVKEVYALGDIKGGPAFTHVSYDDCPSRSSHQRSCRKPQSRRT